MHFFEYSSICVHENQRKLVMHVAFFHIYKVHPQCICVNLYCVLRALSYGLMKHNNAVVKTSMTKATTKWKWNECTFGNSIRNLMKYVICNKICGKSDITIPNVYLYKHVVKPWPFLNYWPDQFIFVSCIELQLL